jgi:hypothetical protein
LNLPASFQFKIVEPTKKALDDFTRMLFSLWQGLALLINGNITFGDGTIIDNINGTWFNITAPVAPNTDFTLNHNLNRIPAGYLVMEKDRACDVYTGSVAPTTTQITLRATVASAVLRIFVLCLFVSIFSGLTNAQNTLVSGTVTDLGGQTWNNGSYAFNFVPSPQFNGKYQLSGSPYTPVAITGSLDGGGSFTSVAVPSNTNITPTGTGWTLTVCSNGTSVCFTTVNLNITGGSQNVTSSITPLAILIGCGPGVSTYQDSEVRCNIGGSYYSLNLASLRVCQVSASSICSTWASAGGLPSGLAYAAPTLTVSTVGTGNGQLALSGNTSGTATLTAPAVAGTSTNAVISSNVIGVPDGGASNPAIQRSAASNTGLFFSGNNSAFSGSGTIAAIFVGSPGLSGTNTIGMVANGTSGSLAGTGACATTTTVVSGGWAGNLTCTGTTGASTLVVTPGFTAAHGFSCWANDLTTAANILRQSAESTTTCTIAGTVNASDVLTFGAIAY